MADRTHNPLSPAAAQQGFTLVEMLAALAILVLAVTTLLSSLGDSVALRRSTDARLQVAQAVEDLVVRVRETGIRRRAGADSDLDLELSVPDSLEAPGFPGLMLSVREDKVDPKANKADAKSTAAAGFADRPDVMLLRIEATWLDEGEAVSETFLRVVPRQLPLAARIQRFREENPR